MQWLEFVMHGLVPAIHVLAAVKQERRGWPGRSPAMTNLKPYSIGRSSSQTLAMRSTDALLHRLCPLRRHALAIRTRFVRRDSAVAGSSNPRRFGRHTSKNHSMTPVNVVLIRF